MSKNHAMPRAVVAVKPLRLFLLLVCGTLNSGASWDSAACTPGGTASNETPGVSLELVERPSPGWACDGIEKHLAGTQLRIWLVWQKLRRPRDFPDYTTERQKAVWRAWDRTVTVRFTLCPEETQPAETAKSCLDAPFELYVQDDDVDWLVSQSAMEAVLTSRGRLIPEECGRNSYAFRVRYWPTHLSDEDVIKRTISALQNEDPTVRILAATTLGRRGDAAKELAIPALRARASDGDPSVREACANALEDLGEE